MSIKTWTMLGTAALAGLLASGVRAETLAKVGGDAITREEFDAKAKAEEATAKRALSAEERQALLRSLVNQRLLVAEARHQKLDREAAFKAFQADVERKALADRVYEAEVSSKSAVTLEDAKQFYQQNPALFDLAEVSQILVAVAKKEDAPAAEKKAKALKDELAKALKGFAKAAREKSDDPGSKAKGGDLGALRRGMLVAELDQAVFNAKPGQVIGPVATQFGFHVLHVRSLRRQTWEEAGQGLQQELQRLRAMKLQEALLERLGKDNKVTYTGARP